MRADAYYCLRRRRRRAADATDISASVRAARVRVWVRVPAAVPRELRFAAACSAAARYLRARERLRACHRCVLLLLSATPRSWCLRFEVVLRVSDVVFTRHSPKGDLFLLNNNIIQTFKRQNKHSRYYL